MITNGAGGYVTITAGETDPLADPYAVRAWAAGTDYKRDDQVSTSSTDGTDLKFWVAKDDHAAEAGDNTPGGANDEASTLDDAHWEEIDAGELIELIDWTITRPIAETQGTSLLRETSPRTTNTPGIVTLALNFADNFEGGNTQRALAVPNKRVYVSLFPKGKGEGLEVMKGYMRVGESTKTGQQSTDVASAVTLTADGDFPSPAQA